VTASPRPPARHGTPQETLTRDLPLGTDQVAGWLGLLAAFDPAFLHAGFLVFGYLLGDWAKSVALGA